MPPRKKKSPLPADTLAKIIARYNQERLLVSDAYCDGGTSMLWPRFERAVMNQCESGEATLSRYAIWANTVRDNIIEGLRHLETDNSDEARKFLTQAANSLSAFADVQAYFDPFEMGKKGE